MNRRFWYWGDAKLNTAEPFLLKSTCRTAISSKSITKRLFSFRISTRQEIGEILRSMRPICVRESRLFSRPRFLWLLNGIERFPLSPFHAVFLLFNKTSNCPILPFIEISDRLCNVFLSMKYTIVLFFLSLKYQIAHSSSSSSSFIGLSRYSTNERTPLRTSQWEGATCHRNPKLPRRRLSIISSLFDWSLSSLSFFCPWPNQVKAVVLALWNPPPPI